MFIDDYEGFCEKTPRFPGTNNPFTQDGFLYATDGLVAIREPTTIEDLEPHGRVPLLMSNLAWNHDTKKEWRPWGENFYAVVDENRLLIEMHTDEKCFIPAKHAELISRLCYVRFHPAIAMNGNTPVMLFRYEEHGQGMVSVVYEGKESDNGKTDDSRPACSDRPRMPLEAEDTPAKG